MPNVGPGGSILAHHAVRIRLKRAEAGRFSSGRTWWNRSRQRCYRRHHGEEIRIRDDKLLLYDSVVTFCRERVAEAETIVEHAESGANHALGPRPSGAPARRPGHADTRREVPPV